jgi:predicted dehydrogenase
VVKGDDLALWDVEGENHYEDATAGQKGGAADPKGGMQENAVVSHVKQIGDVIEAIEEDRQPVLSGQEARRAVEVILSIYKASETGEPVDLG